MSTETITSVDVARERKAALADHAQHLFRVKGYDATTIDDITERAGVSRRTFFNYFESKAEAFWFQKNEPINRLHRDLETIDTNLDPWEQVIQAQVRWAEAMQQSDRTRARDMLYIIAAADDLQFGVMKLNRHDAGLICSVLLSGGGTAIDRRLAWAAAITIVQVTEANLRAWAREDSLDLASTTAVSLRAVAKAFGDLANSYKATPAADA